MRFVEGGSVAEIRPQRRRCSLLYERINFLPSSERRGSVWPVGRPLCVTAASRWRDSTGNWNLVVSDYICCHCDVSCNLFSAIYKCLHLPTAAWAPAGVFFTGGQIHRRSQDFFLDGCTFFLEKVDDLFLFLVVTLKSKPKQLNKPLRPSKSPPPSKKKWCADEKLRK